MKIRLTVLSLLSLLSLSAVAQRVSELPSTNRVELNTIISISARTGPTNYVTRSIALSNVFQGTFTNLMNQYISNVVVQIVTNSSSGNYILKNDDFGTNITLMGGSIYSADKTRVLEVGNSAVLIVAPSGTPTIKADAGNLSLEPETSGDELHLVGNVIVENGIYGNGLGLSNAVQILAGDANTTVTPSNNFRTFLIRSSGGGGWTGNANQFNVAASKTNIINGATLTNSIFWASNGMPAARFNLDNLHSVAIATNGAFGITADGGISETYVGWWATNVGWFKLTPAGYNSASYTAPAFDVTVGAQDGANSGRLTLTTSNVNVRGLFCGGIGLPTTIASDDGSVMFSVGAAGLQVQGLTNSGFPNLVTVEHINGAASAFGAASISTLVQLLLFGADTTSKSATLTNNTSGMQVVNASLVSTNLTAKNLIAEGTMYATGASAVSNTLTVAQTGGVTTFHVGNTGNSGNAAVMHAVSTSGTVDYGGAGLIIADSTRLKGIAYTTNAPGDMLKPNILLGNLYVNTNNNITLAGFANLTAASAGVIDYFQYFVTNTAANKTFTIPNGGMMANGTGTTTATISNMFMCEFWILNGSFTNARATNFK